MNHYDINLGDIFIREYFENVDDDRYIRKLKRACRDQLQQKGLFFSEEELLQKGYDKNHHSIVSFTLESKDSSSNESHKNKKVYVDLSTTAIITPNDGGYHFFLFLRLMHLSISQIDDFLNYQSEIYHKTKGKDFSRLLHIAFREFEGIHFTETEYKKNQLSNIRDTVYEWINKYNYIKSEPEEPEEFIEDRFTNAQIVIIYKLREQQNRTVFHQDEIRFINLICKEAGYKFKSIKERMLAYKVNEGFIHGRSKQDLEDYKVVKQHFESINSKKIVEIINERIEVLEKLLKNKKS